MAKCSCCNNKLQENKNLCLMYIYKNPSFEDKLHPLFSTKLNTVKTPTIFSPPQKQKHCFYLHNICFVHSRDFASLVVPGILKGKFCDTSRSIFGDQFYTLHYAIDNFVLDAGVFTFGVLSDCDYVYFVVQGFVTRIAHKQFIKNVSHTMNH